MSERGRFNRNVTYSAFRIRDCTRSLSLLNYLPGHGLYVSELQHLAVEVFIMPAKTFVSMPSSSPSFIASHTPAIEMPSTKLLHNFATAQKSKQCSCKVVTERE